MSKKCLYFYRAEGQRYSLDNKIVGPGEAPAGAFPWMVALLIDGKQFCGGSLIDSVHVLTAVCKNIKYLKVNVKIKCKHLKIICLKF